MAKMSVLMIEDYQGSFPWAIYVNGDDALVEAQACNDREESGRKFFVMDFPLIESKVNDNG
jgi:hypothetical protein